MISIALSSSKLNIAANIPIAPMSPQLSNVRSSSVVRQQTISSVMNESKSSLQTKRSVYISPNSLRRSQRTSMTTTTTIHSRRRTPFNIDSSAANSSSTSPINLSRSTSPAASIANFIRPISPPYIQVKEPLSPKFSRVSSTTMTLNSMTTRHRSPPLTTMPTQISPTSVIPSIANNIDASTASATTTLLIDDSSGYDSSENQNQRTPTIMNSIVDTNVSIVPESCFEPETYRNLYPLTNNQQKKLSFSDPTLNQISRTTNHCQQELHDTVNVCSHVSASSLVRQMTNDEHDIHTDDDIEHMSNDDEHPSNEKITNNRTRSRHVSQHDASINEHKRQQTTIVNVFQRYSSPRHRMMTCTSGINDSLMRLSPSSDADHQSNHRTDHSNETSFYVMQNRPP
jgi:hypothetical protein